MTSGTPSWSAIQTVAATSSTITADLTAASAVGPTVKTPWFLRSTADESPMCSTTWAPIASLPIRAKPAHGISTPTSSAIPVYLTAIADEVGVEIPCAGFALIGSEAIGAQVVEHIGDSSAVLLKNHGVFTVGPTAEAAVKSAVMVEDVAATVWMALQLGVPDVILAEDVAKLHERYMNVYGQ